MNVWCLILGKFITNYSHFVQFPTVFISSNANSNKTSFFTAYTSKAYMSKSLSRYTAHLKFLTQQTKYKQAGAELGQAQP